MTGNAGIATAYSPFAPRTTKSSASSGRPRPLPLPLLLPLRPSRARGAQGARLLASSEPYSAPPWPPLCTRPPPGPPNGFSRIVVERVEVGRCVGRGPSGEVRLEQLAPDRGRVRWQDRVAIRGRRGGGSAARRIGLAGGGISACGADADGTGGHCLLEWRGR